MSDEKFTWDITEIEFEEDVKYSPDQARDYHGRWTEAPGAEEVGGSGLPYKPARLPGLRDAGSYWSNSPNRAVIDPQDHVWVLDGKEGFHTQIYGRLLLSDPDKYGEALVNLAKEVVQENYQEDTSVEAAVMEELQTYSIEKIPDYTGTDLIVKRHGFEKGVTPSQGMSALVRQVIDDIKKGVIDYPDVRLINVYYGLSYVGIKGSEVDEIAGVTVDQDNNATLRYKAWKYSVDQPRDYHGRWTAAPGSEETGGSSESDLDRLQDDPQLYASAAETAYCFDKDGKLLWQASQNQESQVKFTDQQFAEMLDKITLHNHPNPVWTFSPADIQCAAMADVLEIRVTCKVGIYSMLRPSGGWQWDPILFQEAVKGAAQDVFDAHHGQVDSVMTSEVLEATWQRYSKMTGAQYKFTPRAQNRTKDVQAKYSPAQPRDYHGRWTDQDEPEPPHEPNPWDEMETDEPIYTEHGLLDVKSYDDKWLDERAGNDKRRAVIDKDGHVWVFDEMGMNYHTQIYARMVLDNPELYPDLVRKAKEIVQDQDAEDTNFETGAQAQTGAYSIEGTRMIHSIDRENRPDYIFLEIRRNQAYGDKLGPGITKLIRQAQRDYDRGVINLKFNNIKVDYGSAHLQMSYEEFLTFSSATVDTRGNFPVVLPHFKSLAFVQARKALEQLVAKVLAYVKTVEHFRLVLERYVRALYGGSMDEHDFVDQLADLIQQQLTRAWAEGMRQNGLDPVKDMEERWQGMLEDIILIEYEYVDQFAADIVAGADAGDKIDRFLFRAGLWANRYREVVNTAVQQTKIQKLKWVLGATEDHCPQCYALNGKVAFSDIWISTGVHPQQPPNPFLGCEGWQCQCALVPTTERQTYDAMNVILKIVTKTGKSLDHKYSPDQPRDYHGRWTSEQRAPVADEPVTDYTRIHQLEDLPDFYARQGEIAFVYDRTGKLIASPGKGEAHAVNFTDAEAMACRDQILVHNHPTGRSFSSGDIRFAYGVNIYEIRATGRLGTYSMIRPPNGWQDYDVLYNTLIDRAGKRMDWNLATEDEVLGPEGIMQGLMMEEYAKATGATLTFTPRERADIIKRLSEAADLQLKGGQDAKDS